MDLTPSEDVWNFLQAADKSAARRSLGTEAFVYVDGTVVATTADLGVTIFTDANSTGYSQVNLPTHASALEHGGVIRVLSTREWASDTNFISVFPFSGDGTPFKIGANTFWSLFSTGIGDYLELLPITINSDPFWQVINFSGLWQDRD